jgi:glutamate synthase domain-containing protein 2
MPSLSRINASAATLTKNRTENSIVPLSGMCVTCIDGCIGMCEIGKSAYRGHEVIYPQPFGILTAASEKNYPVDYSHFNIMGTAVGAVGIEADPDKAIFPNVNVEQKIGADKTIKLKFPMVVPGLGSTNVAKNNWDGLAIGTALSGCMLTIGENVVAMDMGSEIKNNRILKAPDLEYRVKTYQKWQQNGYGMIIVQANVEDTRLGVQEFAIQKLGVQAVELKWGQGAKDIGGEVKIKDLKKAQTLRKRGYVVLPNPLDPDIIEAFNKRSFTEFERHSRIGMVDEESFCKRVEELRQAGAKYVFLKTGAYRPADLARAIKYASEAKIDLLTVDGAGGGTGMSPWHMMNEWGMPPLEIHSLTYFYADRLKKKGKYVPDIAFAGGIAFEDQIFKALALGAPYTKLVGMARGPLCAAMVGKTIGKKIAEEEVPVFIERFGNKKEDIFVTAATLKKELGKDFDKVPTGALGVYTYIERLAQGLRQLMTGNRKFALKHLSRDDIASLTKDCTDVSGIPYVMDVDQKEVEKILNS